MPNNVERPTATYYNTNYEYTFIQNKDSDGPKMHGIRRVITFCILTTLLPTILIILPLYLRNTRYADVMYKISDSEVIQIHKGQSSIFCEKHSLRMNGPFNAFQMKGRPILSEKRKHIRLKKSMTLPDDTLEYWGFYLFKGAKVELKACSRYEGSKILVVKGDNILNTCGILEDSTNKADRHLIEKPEHVSVTLENPQRKQEEAEEVFNTLDDEEDEALLATRNIIQHDINKHSKFNHPGENKHHDGSLRNIQSTVNKNKVKRDIKSPPLHNPNTVLDAGVYHGGNAFNSTTTDSSVSSFELSLLECYSGNMLINEYFPYSTKCNGSNYLEKTTTLKVTHDVLQDGYYYYIFYSDNDIVQNDIHAIFDIYKPTFQYTNMSESKVCVNQTECEFDVAFFSDELVIVEVPTKDGIRSAENDSSILTSVCHPRVNVYVFFPIAVLMMILLFAFL
ncbi:uncharacterized protein LOC105384069 isoform X1 [Plutella xylostella]|uniref:uncharacterized protein LOC105384069 isoform X1 n=2 Tax=Plutella xylostella TaxID=51655 RepID=UPI0020322025|nr:uncharacterized protein LOC105384069 isoform X1 [Plutella xylostella]